MALIGLLGGTFDPVHNAHIYMGQEAKKQLGLDKVLYIPNGNPPHKSTVRTDGKMRFEMVRLAIADYDGFEASDFEVKKKTACYSVETVTYFKEAFPKDEFVFIVGEDSLDYIDRWYKPEILLKLCRFAVIGRGGFDSNIEEKISFLKEKFGAEISYVKAKELEISSSEIRERILKNEDVSDFVPKKVLEYIKNHKLYI